MLMGLADVTKMQTIREYLAAGRPIKGCYIQTFESTGKFRGRVVDQEGDRIRIDCTWSEKTLWRPEDLQVMEEAYLVRIEDWGRVYRSNGPTTGITGAMTAILTEDNIRSQVRNTKEGVHKDFQSKDGHEEKIKEIVASERACQTNGT